MPQVRDYPPAQALSPSDAFLLDQEGVGTVYATLEQLQAFLSGGAPIGHGLLALNFQWPAAIPDEVALFSYMATSGFTLFANLVNGSASLTAGAAGECVLDLLKNGNRLGTITFTATEAGQAVQGVAVFPATVFDLADVLSIASASGLSSTKLALLLTAILT